ncbi:MAG: CBS domain-containing protein [Polyangiaceae bacterium]|nr:CBS domain-containing protein [Polyangiaceae bacterium]
MNLQKQTAETLMTRQLLTISADQTLRAAAALMHAHHVHCLIVPPTEEALCVGILTAKDIVQILCDGEPHLLEQLRVADAFTSPAITVQKDFTIVDCLRLMRMSGVRSVPVLDGVKLVGILSFSDVLRVVATG